MDFENLPVKMAKANTDGINDAVDLLSSRGDAKDVARMLSEQPLDVIRKVLSLNRYQRAGLAELKDDEVKELVEPVVKVLQSEDPGQMRGLRLVESIVRESPIRIRCRIEIEW